jgi:hypothetical protein
MKKLVKISIVFAFTIFTNFAIAQNSLEEKTKIIIAKLTTKLTLSNEQQLQLKDIFLTHYNMMRDLKMQFKNEDKESNKKAAREQRVRTEQQVMMILNVAQQSKYNEEKMKMRKNIVNRNNKKVNPQNAKIKTPVEVDVEEQLDEEAF